MRLLKNSLVLFGLLISFISNAQMVEDPTTWKYEVKKTGENEYDLIVHLNLKEHWHIYSQNPGGDEMLIPPTFEFEKNSKVKLVGKVKEKGALITQELEGIEGAVNYYEHKVDFIQKVKVSGNTNVKLDHGYQVCDESMCLPPKYIDHTFKITDATTADETSAPNTDEADEKKNDEVGAVNQDDTNNSNATTPVASTKDSSNNDGAATNNLDAEKVDKKEKQKSLLTIFFLALVGGLLAVLTPCVYSMIPITVSFFTKRSKTRAEGIKNAFLYSLSIIVIFTTLGVAISAIFGADALNVLSTHWIPNLIFFAIFVIFGISFLGAFEITLPSSWTSKTDSKANTQSFTGIFFMALTLVIVSFSCTGPIIGPLIVGAAKGGFQGPIFGMLGFSIGLALPFALFAVFPGLLNNIAKSGGWLNQVKVTLGFIELMLALKFLSNADLQMGWRILDREVFIALWIVLSVLLGMYLLGKLKLSHDDSNPKNIFGQEYISIFKLFLAIGCFSFAVYMVPGMWGAPLKSISAFVPPMGTQDFILGANTGGGGHSDNGDPNVATRKYVSKMETYEPEVVVKYGLITYFDYNEGLEISKKLKKPIMLDFTGIGCVNCRKMENQVWSDPQVMKMLKEDFIVVSLYVDAQNVKIPEEEQYESEYLKKRVTNLGQLNTDIQVTKYGSNSQPIYFFIDENENRLAEEGYPYIPDVDKFVKHLETVKAEYEKRH